MVFKLLSYTLIDAFSSIISVTLCAYNVMNVILFRNINARCVYARYPVFDHNQYPL